MAQLLVEDMTLKLSIKEIKIPHLTQELVIHTFTKIILITMFSHGKDFVVLQVQTNLK